jgi:hypothetical protein
MLEIKKMTKVYYNYVKEQITPDKKLYSRALFISLTSYFLLTVFVHPALFVILALDLLIGTVGFHNEWQIGYNARGCFILSHYIFLNILRVINKNWPHTTTLNEDLRDYILKCRTYGSSIDLVMFKLNYPLNKSKKIDKLFKEYAKAYHLYSELKEDGRLLYKFDN